MAGRYSPFDLTDRRAAGHPNGYCQECGRPAASLRADFCSPGCRGRHADREAREASLEAEAREYERARATVIPDEDLARREPERPDGEGPVPGVSR